MADVFATRNWKPSSATPFMRCKSFSLSGISGLEWRAKAQDVFDVAGKTLAVTWGPCGQPLRRQTLTVSRYSKSCRDFELEIFPTLNTVLMVLKPSESCSSKVEDHVCQLDHLVPVVVNAYPFKFSTPAIRVLEMVAGKCEGVSLVFRYKAIMAGVQGCRRVFTVWHSGTPAAETQRGDVVSYPAPPPT